MFANNGGAPTNGAPVAAAAVGASGATAAAANNASAGRQQNKAVQKANAAVAGNQIDNAAKQAMGVTGLSALRARIQNVVNGQVVPSGAPALGGAQLGAPSATAPSVTPPAATILPVNVAVVTPGGAPTGGYGAPVGGSAPSANACGAGAVPQAQADMARFRKMEEAALANEQKISELTPKDIKNYEGWKGGATYGDYRALRKYLKWREHAGRVVANDYDHITVGRHTISIIIMTATITIHMPVISKIGDRI